MISLEAFKVGRIEFFPNAKPKTPNFLSPNCTWFHVEWELMLSPVTYMLQLQEVSEKYKVSYVVLFGSSFMFSNFYIEMSNPTIIYVHSFRYKEWEMILSPSNYMLLTAGRFEKVQLGMWVLCGLVLMFSNFYKYYPQNKSCVAFANLQWSINKVGFDFGLHLI